MHVLIVSTFPPRRCGIGDYTSDLADELSKMDDLRVTVLTYEDGEGSDSSSRGKISVIRALRERTSPRELTTALSRIKPDLVHLQSSTFLHSGSVNRSIVCACKSPLVSSVHDTPSSWRVFYTIPNLRALYQKSKCLFTHSRGVSQILEEFHRVEDEKITRISHGVDINRFRPDIRGEGAVRKYGLDGRKIVLFFGFLRPGKGLETLLDAWAAIEHEIPDALLVIAGGNPSHMMRYDLLLRSEASYPQQLRRLAAKLQITDRVLFTDYVPSGDAPELFAAADVVVLPYEGNASQSGPLHKALASGKPIVATCTPGFNELLDNEKDSLLVPPRDAKALAKAIRFLIENPTVGREMGRLARSKAEANLAWSLVAGRVYQTYRHALGS